MFVCGSALMFADHFFEKEDNARFWDVIETLMTTNEIHLNIIDAEEPDLTDYHQAPDIDSLATTLRVCLQESDELPRDVTTMFDTSLYTMDTRHLPSVNQ